MSDGQQRSGSVIPDDDATISRGGSHAANDDSLHAVEPPVSGSFTGHLAPDHQHLLDDLAATIDEFRNGRLEKTKAYTQLFNRLTAYDDTNISQGQKITAFATYSKELESAEANTVRASERGRAYLPTGHPSRPDAPIEPQSGSQHKRRASGSPEHEREGNGGKEHPAYQLSRYIEQPGGATQFAADASAAGTVCRFTGTKSSVAADEDDDDGEGRGSKRSRRAIEAHMPWYNHSDDPDTGPLRSSCEQTVRLLREYHIDIPGSRFFAEMARGSPAGFPSSQWDRILRGQALDLNVVLTSIHRTSIDEETKGRLGDQEIRIVVSDAKRVVRTSIDWVSAWRRAAAAYSFAFPHRTKEVTAYGDYIQGEFEAKIVSSHHKVISFDKAIRNLVGGGQQLLLTDDHKFSKFYSSILMSDGSRADDPRYDVNNGPRGTINPGSRKGGGKIDICRRYNGAKGCNRSDGECNYRHICDLCKKAGHSAQKCNVEKK